MNEHVDGEGERLHRAGAIFIDDEFSNDQNSTRNQRAENVLQQVSIFVRAGHVENVAQLGDRVATAKIILKNILANTSELISDAKLLGDLARERQHTGQIHSGNPYVRRSLS